MKRKAKSVKSRKQRRGKKAMDLLAFNTQTHFHFPISKIIPPRRQRQCSANDLVLLSQFSKEECFSSNMRWKGQPVHERTKIKQLHALRVISSGLEDSQASSSQFEEFSVTPCKTDKANELKISMVVEGKRTQAIFDDVFSSMVADAQPIPGFRRVKGGKTTNIPKNILLEILGPSKVYKQVIKRIISSTISDYVQKEGLSVGKDLRVQQSFEDLEATFEPGDQFKFEAILQCQD
ncbi:uncharacterized protein [Coffea arabica]|uniref:peptidylprolyl isomerase n=1 Tax=Coffea arabica TaxID=13443 RepID=A0A6P6SJL2_COFAR|nr:uncharacterized protein LOC113691903 isoform X1 [Coffea arabica]